MTFTSKSLKSYLEHYILLIYYTDKEKKHKSKIAGEIVKITNKYILFNINRIESEQRKILIKKIISIQKPELYGM